MNTFTNAAATPQIVVQPDLFSWNVRINNVVVGRFQTQHSAMLFATARLLDMTRPRIA